MLRDYTELEVFQTLTTHTKFHVNWLNTFENRGGGPIDPLMPSCNFFFMSSWVKTICINS